MGGDVELLSRHPFPSLEFNTCQCNCFWFIWSQTHRTRLESMACQDCKWKFGKIKTPTPNGPIVQNFTKNDNGTFIFHLIQIPKGTIAEEICLPNFHTSLKKKNILNLHNNI